MTLSAEEMEERLLAVEQFLSEMNTDNAADTSAPSPLNWEELIPPARAALMMRVGEFVEFLDRTYLQWSEYELKKCWHLHPDVVWELTALREAFAAAYNAGTVGTDAMLVWHERALWPTLERIRTRAPMKPCNAQNHQPEQRPRLEFDDTRAARHQAWMGGDDIPLPELPASNLPSDRAGDEIPPSESSRH